MKIIEPTPPVYLKDFIIANTKRRINKFHDTIMTLRGRDAISIAFNHFDLENKSTILLPGYLCDVIDSPLINKFNIEYYDIGEDFSIRTSDIESIIRKHKIKVLYIIHYFGFIQENLKQISELCKKYSVLLFEDHAHSAISKFSFDYADAMIFSFRKILPVPDGGGLWIKDLQEIKYDNFSKIHSDILSLLILLKRSKLCVNKIFKNRTKHIAQNITNSTFHDFQKRKIRPISFMSKRIIQSTDYEELFSTRRDLFKKWQNLFSNSRIRPVFLCLPDNTCPQGFPVRVQNPQEIIRHFENMNIFLKVHWPLRGEMKQKCPMAFNISKSIITLPLYPGLSESDMERILNIVNNYGIPIDENK